MSKIFNPASSFNGKVMQNDMYSAVIDGEIIRDIPAQPIYIDNYAELALLVDEPAGAIAITYGLGAMYHKLPDGTWLTVYDSAPAH